MRAIRMHEYGQPPRLDEVASPGPPGRGRIIVAVTAVGVGAWDQGVVSGRLAVHVKQEAPFIMGAELAGRVSEVGAGVTGFAVGDRVMGNPGIVGAWAERAVIDADRCGHAPRSLDDAQVAAIPVSGLTAWQALELLALPSSASLLVLGAGGGVGRAAVQLARHRVANVIAIARSHEVSRSLELGAELAYDDSQDWVGAVRVSMPEGVDGILDLIGGDRLQEAIPIARVGGRIVTTLSEAAGTPVPDGIAIEFLPMRSRTADLEALAVRVDEDELSLPAERILPFDEAPTIVDDRAPEHLPGKVVLTL